MHLDRQDFSLRHHDCRQCQDSSLEQGPFRRNSLPCLKVYSYHNSSPWKQKTPWQEREAWIERCCRALFLNMMLQYLSDFTCQEVAKPHCRASNWSLKEPHCWPGEDRWSGFLYVCEPIQKFILPANLHSKYYTFQLFWFVRALSRGKLHPHFNHNSWFLLDLSQSALPQYSSYVKWDQNSPNDINLFFVHVWPSYVWCVVWSLFRGFGHIQPLLLCTFSCA